MSFDTEINFLRERKKYGGYGGYTLQYRKVKWEKFAFHLLESSMFAFPDGGRQHVMRYYLNSKVPNGFMKRSHHVLTLDCDSFDGMQRATSHLFRDDVSHSVFESSPGRYWVVACKVGKFKDVYRYMRLIPGVDRNYVNATGGKKSFILRAYPKNGRIPKFRCEWMSDTERRARNLGFSEDYDKYQTFANYLNRYFLSDTMLTSRDYIRQEMDSVNVSYNDSETYELAMRLGSDAQEKRWERLDYNPRPSEQEEVEVEEAEELEQEKEVIEINNCLDHMEL